MSAAQHTPGPWKAYPHPFPSTRDPSWLISATDQDGETSTLATIWHFDEAMEANAQLAASAPTLLAALEDLYNGALDAGVDKWMPHRMERAHAAIAAARGEASA